MPDNGVHSKSEFLNHDYVLNVGAQRGYTASLMTPVVAPSVRAVSSLTLVRARLNSTVIGYEGQGALSLVNSKKGTVKVVHTRISTS